MNLIFASWRRNKPKLNRDCSPLKRCRFKSDVGTEKRMFEKIKNAAIYMVEKISSFIFLGDGKAPTRPGTWFLGGRKRWAGIIDWMKVQGLNLSLFALRYLKWWFYFFANCVIAVTATSFGFSLGVVLIVLFHDDGLERVTDLYNYFKNPPRS